MRISRDLNHLIGGRGLQGEGVREEGGLTAGMRGLAGYFLIKVK